MIAGQPAMKVRDFLHYVAHANLWTAGTAAARLGMSVDDAKEVIFQLAALGYIGIIRVRLDFQRFLGRCREVYPVKVESAINSNTYVERTSAERLSLTSSGR
jgi:hypothetical protein